MSVAICSRSNDFLTGLFPKTCDRPIFIEHFCINTRSIKNKNMQSQIYLDYVISMFLGSLG